MNGVVIMFLIILAVFLLLIAITLASLPKSGDERANYIKMKAQSSMFIVVIGIVLLELIEAIYVTFWTDSSYEGMNPLSFFVSISVIYLISLLVSKKKYSG